MIKNNIRELVSETKIFKVQSKLFLEYNKKNDPKIFHLNVKLIANDLGINEAFKSMHQNIMRKIKDSSSEDCVVETIVKHCFKIFQC